MSERIFISSVQKELAEERRVIRDFVRGDALLRRFFDVFLFEDIGECLGRHCRSTRCAFPAEATLEYHATAARRSNLQVRIRIRLAT